MNSQKPKSVLNQFANQSGLPIETILAISARNQPRTRISKSSYFTPQGHLQNIQPVKKQIKSVPLEKKCQQHKPQRPDSAQSFTQAYKKFLVQQCNETLNESFIKWIDNNKKCLFEMLQNSLIQQSQGGIIKIIAEGRVKAQFDKFVIPLNATSAQQAFEKYKKYLLRYQFYLTNNFIKTKNKLQDLIHSAIFVSQSQLAQLLNKTPLNLKYYEEDILVLKNGQSTLKINPQTISLDIVAQKYKDFIVDIRIQKPMDFGFNVNKLRNQPFQMKISDYRKYQKICQNNSNISFKQKPQLIKQLGVLQNISVNGTKFSQRLKKGEIFFAVNFDPSDGLLIDHIQQHVKNSFLGYKQSFDLLSYLDHEVPGCSLPQFYFKVKGVWTGGHQQNINMCAININHGPDPSQWYTMNACYVQQFRNVLKQKFKIDLYAQEGLWYQKINWFLENNFPIKKIIQKKGDVVISGPGTLHWVRSYGVALQSAWNLFPTTYHQFKLALHRHAQNKKLKFIRSNTIPLKSLIIKYLNHQHGHMLQNVQNLLIKTVEMWFNEEEKLIKQIRQLYQIQQHAKHQKLQDLQSFCEICRQQVLMYFVDGLQTGIMCLQCYKDKSNSKMRKQNNQKIYHKNYPGSILELLNSCKTNKQFIEYEQFCNAPYVGKNTKCKFKNQVCKSDHLKQNQFNLIQKQIEDHKKGLMQNNCIQNQKIKQREMQINKNKCQIKNQVQVQKNKEKLKQHFKYEMIQENVQQLPNSTVKADNNDVNIIHPYVSVQLHQKHPQPQTITKVYQEFQNETNQFKRQRNYLYQKNNSPVFSSNSDNDLQKKPNQFKIQLSSQNDKVKKKVNYLSSSSQNQKKKKQKKHKKQKQKSQKSHQYSNQQTYNKKYKTYQQQQHRQHRRSRSRQPRRQKSRQNKYYHDEKFHKRSYRENDYGYSRDEGNWRQKKYIQNDTYYRKNFENQINKGSNINFNQNKYNNQERKNYNHKSNYENTTVKDDRYNEKQKQKYQPTDY